MSGGQTESIQGTRLKPSCGSHANARWPALAAIAVAALCLTGYGNLVIGFDDVKLETGEPEPVPDGYMGLEWDPHWRVFSYATLPDIEPSSAPNAAGLHEDGWNTLQADASVGFRSVSADPFEGGYLAGDPDVEVRFLGWLGDDMVGVSPTLTLSSNPTFLSAKFPGPVDKVVVHAERKLATSMFYLDGIAYAPGIPEAGSLALITLGAAGMLRKRAPRT